MRVKLVIGVLAFCTSHCRRSTVEQSRHPEPRAAQDARASAPPTAQDAASTVASRPQREELGRTLASLEPSAAAQRANNAALDHHRAGRFAQSKLGFEAALALAPDWPTPRYNLACALARLSALDDAARELSVALRQDLPEFARGFQTDVDLRDLRGSTTHAQQINSLIDSLTDAWNSALSRGTATVQFAPARDGSCGNPSQLRPGVWIADAQRWLAASRALDRLSAIAFDRPLRRAIAVHGCWQPLAGAIRHFDANVEILGFLQWNVAPLRSARLHATGPVVAALVAEARATVTWDDVLDLDPDAPDIAPPNAVQPYEHHAELAPGAPWRARFGRPRSASAPAATTVMTFSYEPSIDLSSLGSGVHAQRRLAAPSQWALGPEAPPFELVRDQLRFAAGETASLSAIRELGSSNNPAARAVVTVAKAPTDGVWMLHRTVSGCDFDVGGTYSELYRIDANAHTATPVRRSLATTMALVRQSDGTLCFDDGLASRCISSSSATAAPLPASLRIHAPSQGMICGA